MPNSLKQRPSTEFDMPSLSSFKTRRFTEETDSLGVLHAWRIHAQDYLASNYVTNEAVVDDGTLSPDVDTARGDDVIYYLGVDTGTGTQATLRKKLIPKGGRLEDLVNYSISNNMLYPQEKDNLLEHIDQHGARAVVEICALARSNNRNSLASLALVRALMYESVDNGLERWFILFAKPAYLSFRRRFGDNIVLRAGDELSIGDSGGLVAPNLRFVPAIIDPSSILSTLKSEARPGQGRRSQTFSQTLEFMRTKTPIQGEDDRGGTEDYVA